MGLGSTFKNLLNKSKNKKPEVPPLDSKKNDVPEPSNPFSGSQNPNPQAFQSDGKGQGNQNSSGIDDLPDFPDFPGQSSTDQNTGNQNEPSLGIEAPNSDVSMPNPIQQNQRSTSMQGTQKSSDESSSRSDYFEKEDKLEGYESSNNDKRIGFPSIQREDEGDFINIHDYKEVLECIDTLKDNTSAFDNSMMQLNDLNNSCASQEESFKKTIEDIQRKLIFVDKTLFESHGK